MFLEMMSFDFMQNAFIAGLLVAIACGIMGSFVVVNKLTGLSGGVAHASYGGVGLACFFGFSPMLGALGFALACALLMGVLTWKNRTRSDTLIGVIWAFGMALGVVLTDLTPGYASDMMSFLFGSILTVPSSLIVIMFMLLFLIVSLTLFYYRDFLLLSYDPEFAQVKGVRVFPLYLLLIVLITFTVVMAVQAVGLILVIALLTIPAYVAESHVNQLKHMIMISVGLSLILVISGLFLAFKINFTGGPVIILLSVFLYLINLGMMTLQKKWRR